jgi:hypothetical protein
VQNVYWMEVRGVLRTAVRGKKGGITYDRDEIMRVDAERRRMRLKNDNAVRAFEMFAQGFEHHDVVIKLSLDPDYVTELWEKFKRGYRRETPEERDERLAREHDARMLVLDQKLLSNAIGIPTATSSTTSSATSIESPASPDVQSDALHDHAEYLAQVSRQRATTSAVDPLLRRAKEAIEKARKHRDDKK